MFPQAECCESVDRQDGSCAVAPMRLLFESFFAALQVVECVKNSEAGDRRPSLVRAGPVCERQAEK